MQQDILKRSLEVKHLPCTLKAHSVLSPEAGESPQSKTQPQKEKQKLNSKTEKAE